MAVRFSFYIEMTETGGDTPPEQGPEEEETETEEPDPEKVNELIKKYMDGFVGDDEVNEDEVKEIKYETKRDLRDMDISEHFFMGFLNDLTNQLRVDLPTVVNNGVKQAQIDYEKNKIYFQTSSDTNEYVFNLNYPAVEKTLIGSNLNPWTTGNVICNCDFYSDTLNKVFPWNHSDEISFHAVSMKGIPCPWYGCDFTVEVELIVDNEDSYALNE